MDEEPIPQKRGVVVEPLVDIDLGPEIPEMAGYALRMRRITLEPGAVFGPQHGHAGRPGTVYVLSGIITEHRDGQNREYGPGPGWPEDHLTVHWLENAGTEPAVEISVDLVRRP